jgi:hypothetical protein
MMSVEAKHQSMTTHRSAANDSYVHGGGWQNHWPDTSMTSSACGAHGDVVGETRASWPM